MKKEVVLLDVDNMSDEVFKAYDSIMGGDYYDEGYARYKLGKCEVVDAWMMEVANVVKSDFILVLEHG